MCVLSSKYKFSILLMQIICKCVDISLKVWNNSNANRSQLEVDMIKDVNAAYRYVNSRNKKTRRKALAMIREHNRLKEKK